MTPLDPKQLLQIIHDRGEEATVSGRVHDEARAATQELVKWIDAALAREAAAKTEPATPTQKRISFPTPLTATASVDEAHAQ
jgi:hypothetical protein